MEFSTILPLTWKKYLKVWFQEDIPSFDYAGIVVGENNGQAQLLGKSKGILAGVPFFTEIFNQLNCQVEWNLEEGDMINPITNIALVSGKLRKILMGERISLNLLSRLSGIATQSRDLMNLARSNDYNGSIAGTRKTTPGFRLFEKYAILVGGAETHRMDLSSMIMLKDNHIAIVGNVKDAIKRVRSVSSIWLNIEVECQTLKDAEEAIKAGADIIMLDNFNAEKLHKEAQYLKEQYGNKYPFKIEASGGITQENISEYFSPFIDIISLGSLTSSSIPLDFSLKIKK